MKMHPPALKNEWPEQKKKEKDKIHPKSPQMSVARAALRCPHSPPSGLASISRRKNFHLYILKLPSPISATLKISVSSCINKEKIQ